MHDVAVLTTTFYKDLSVLRCRLALDMTERAIAAHHPVFIVDGSPDPVIKKAFQEIGATVFSQEEPGMGASRRELFRHASNPQNYKDLTTLPWMLLWTEPERPDLIRWISEITAPIRRGEADIVVPERTEKSWASYPAFQVESEQWLNRMYAGITGLRHDQAFGPVVFRFPLVPIYAACNPKKSYGGYDTYIQQIATMEAMARGYRVLSVPIDFEYSPEQRHEEEITIREEMLAKRNREAMRVAEMFLLAWRVLHHQTR